MRETVSEYLALHVTIFPCNHPFHERCEFHTASQTEYPTESTRTFIVTGSSAHRALIMHVTMLGLWKRETVEEAANSLLNVSGAGCPVTCNLSAPRTSKHQGSHISCSETESSNDTRLYNRMAKSENHLLVFGASGISYEHCPSTVPSEQC